MARKTTPKSRTAKSSTSARGRKTAPKTAPVADTEQLADGVLFDGTDLYVRGDLDAPGEALVVTFSPRRDFATKKRPRSAGFGEDLFRREGLPHVCFISKANHWWHTAELQQAIASLKPKLGRFSRIVTYGVSMGAYGALVAARDLGASHVLAFSPQVDVSGRLPLNAVWRKDLKGVAMVQDLSANPPPPETRITLILDPTIDMDQAHRRDLLALRPAETLPTPFSGHSSALFLADLGLLKPLVLDAVAGRFDLAAHRRSLRENRARHPLYANRLSSWLETRGKPGLARTWRGNAIESILAGARWDPVKANRVIQNHVRQLLAQSRDREARKLIARLLEHPEHAYSGHLARGEMQLAGNAAKSALRQAKAAAQLRPKQSLPFLLLARALLELKGAEAAETQLAKAMARNGAQARDWAIMAEALAKAGLPEASRRTAAFGLARYPGSPPLQAMAEAS